MYVINDEAKALNAVLEKENPHILRMLSDRGKAIFFPKKGILKQSAEASKTKLNATIGIALEDNKEPVIFSEMDKYLLLPPKESVTYASTYGKPELRQKWLELIRKKNPSLTYPTTTPVVTCGITHALFTAGYLFLDEKDTVILPDLFWGNYKLILQNNFNVKFDTYPLFDNGHFNAKGLQSTLKSVSGKTIIILNFPNNPSGYTPLTHEISDIFNVIIEHAVKGNETVILFDDAYFGLTYEENVFKESLFAKFGNAHKNILAVKLDGATKEEFVWGFRVGFITFASKDMSEKVASVLEEKAAGAIRGSISNASHLSQTLIVKAFNSKSYDKEKKEKFDLFKSRYLMVHEVLRNKMYPTYFYPLPFNSGYFMCLGLTKGLDAEKIRKTLLEKYDTGVIATNNVIRIAFSSIQEKDIKTLFDNIYNACDINAQNL